MIVCLVAFLLAWSWVSSPIWSDPFLRDSDAFRAFTGRRKARKTLLVQTGGATVALVFAFAAVGC